LHFQGYFLLIDPLLPLLSIPQTVLLVERLVALFLPSNILGPVTVESRPFKIVKVKGVARLEL
jgi:hypothetical protein